MLKQLKTLEKDIADEKDLEEQVGSDLEIDCNKKELEEIRLSEEHTCHKI